MNIDVLIVGAGAAGLTAAIYAGQAASGKKLQVVLIDSARKPGAKILVSGGGRCNVTNEKVTPEDYWGGPRPIIRNILSAFNETNTIEWMSRLGVRLKREADGKYFPVTEDSKTVLDALLGRVEKLGVKLITDARVTSINRIREWFEVHTTNQPQPFYTRYLVMATGGNAMPESGSDGAGLLMMKQLGHRVIPTTPALCPLELKKSSDVGGRFEEFSGMAVNVRLGLYEESGKRLEEVQDSLLFTHFGISGPAALNLSRHLLRARLERPDKKYHLCMGNPNLETAEIADGWLRHEAERYPARSVAKAISDLYPERLAQAIAGEGGMLGQLTREKRKILATQLTMLPLEVTDSRGYKFAETTAGGVDLREIDYRNMQSTKVEGLFLCGEILNVDGRIGGFNFQWAWSTGCLAGRGVMFYLIETKSD